MFYTLGILKGLQQVADQYVMTGEMRGDLVATNQYTETDLKRLANFTANDSCKYDSAYRYYRIINNCNYYVAHRDTMLHTGSRMVALPEYVEALAVRAWAYMQLCKTYGTVPFYTDPLVSIGDVSRSLPMKDLQGVCDELAPQLARYSGTPVPTYGNISAGVLNSSSSDNPQEKQVVSARAMLPVDLVLADLYLETHQYAQAARYYSKFLFDNKWQVRQGVALPTTSLYSVLGDKMPANLEFTITSGAFTWSGIFSVTGTNDIISYIPMAANRLRGQTTDLPRYFGYDFYSTTGGASQSNARFLLDRQIDASPAYLALAGSQAYYYTPAGSNTADPDVRQADIGDMRRYVCLEQVSKDDSLFQVMIKFNNANIPIYRTALVYLRLAEAVNRMGYPHVSFAILKDGLHSQLLDSLGNTRYLNAADSAFLHTPLPFSSAENITSYPNNWGIHSRGANYTGGRKSPYQLDSVVGSKLAELQRLHGITPTGTKADTINAMEDILCDELALELAFEGNRFGDLTRLARHKNREALYGSDYGSRWLAQKLAFKQPAVSLLDERNWYLPFK